MHVNQWTEPFADSSDSENWEEPRRRGDRTASPSSRPAEVLERHGWGGDLLVQLREPSSI